MQTRSKSMKKCALIAANVIQNKYQKNVKCNGPFQKNPQIAEDFEAIRLIITEQESEKEPEDKGLYEVCIDFDEASEAWRKNKKSTGNGHYRYVCEGFTKTGKNCTREPDACFAFCNWHNKI